MASTHFAVTIYLFDTVGNALFKTENRSFNSEWCDFTENDIVNDPRFNGTNTGGTLIKSKITYYPGGASAHPKEYFVREDIYTLNHLANYSGNISSAGVFGGFGN